MKVLLRHLRGRWEVMAVFPNGRQASLATFDARFRAEEYIESLKEDHEDPVR